MFPYYKDIIEKLGEPKWFTENGYPRYCEFSPEESSDIYADEVVLLRIACQGCKTQFDVEMTSSFGKRLTFKRLTQSDKVDTLSDEIGKKEIHYGDPPNIECCPAGPTMNCIDVKILQYWRSIDFQWLRYPEFEIEIESLEDYQ
jgi:hypothetical protein